jgi:23S rRNA (adenine2503-C2)-methyltransferase
MRNLEPAEIYDQVLDKESRLYYNHPFEYRFMEWRTLMNYNNVLKAIEMITSPEGLGMSKTDHGFYFWCS